MDKAQLYLSHWKPNRRRDNGAVDLQYLGLTELPKLPHKMCKTVWPALYCNNNNLTTLTVKLDYGLKDLCCSYNFIEDLPKKLPLTLERLYCNNNNINTLSNIRKLPLKRLDCSYNNISKLPEKLTGSLEELVCSNNNLTELPENLPDTLYYLSCNNNPLLITPDCDELFNESVQKYLERLFEAQRRQRAIQRCQILRDELKERVVV